MSESIYSIFLRSPQAALEETFKRDAKRVPWKKGSIFVWQSTMGTNGVRYGSYRDITREELARRPHEIEIADYAISIFWTDEEYDHILNRKVPKNGETSVDDVDKASAGNQGTEAGRA